ncbi:MAG: hypothetical protein M1533_03945 [Candidatus Thermoplasmatota archaeon]|nr:hypothetical protein [Candidatus Thermoplasmatota archaeon]
MNPMFYTNPGKERRTISVTPEGEKALKKFMRVRKIMAAVNVGVSAAILYAAFMGMI